MIADGSLGSETAALSLPYTSAKGRAKGNLGITWVLIRLEFGHFVFCFRLKSSR